MHGTGLQSTELYMAFENGRGLSNLREIFKTGEHCGDRLEIGLHP
jgi:hypothetical protein